MMAAMSTMSGMPLAMLLEGLGVMEPVPEIGIQGLAGDSREVHPGDLFLASQGLRVHGLEFVERAIEQGAVAILWEPLADTSLAEKARSLPVPTIAVDGLSQKLGLIADRFYGSPSSDLYCIGVTGTDGKTSVSHFIAEALSIAGQGCGLLGTLGYGVYGELEKPTHTTPDALRLHAELAALRDRGIRHLAMEVSSHALHQRRTAGVAFDTAVLTQLSRDHLDYHGSVEAYAEAKRRLFETPGLGCAVLNLGDTFGRDLAYSLRHKLRVIAYQSDVGTGLHDFGEWIALKAVRPMAKGLALKLQSSWGDAEFESSLLGGFNAENLLASLGALLASGLPFDEAVQALARVKTVPGRMELFAFDGMPHVVVDYAHTPNALESALNALRPHCRGELVCVFGAGGDRDQGKRAQMGSVAERLADRVVLTSDNPRSELPDQIIDQIVSGFEQPQRALRIKDRATAIATAIQEAAADDLVLVAGKGHEDYQQVGSEKRSFSDRLQVLHLLREPGE